MADQPADLIPTEEEQQTIKEQTTGLFYVYDVLVLSMQSDVYEKMMKGFTELCEQWDTLSKGESPTTKAIRKVITEAHKGD